MQDTAQLTGGFDAPAIDSAHAFREIMEAMARPGTIRRVAGGAGPAPMSPAAATLILTLCDGTTPIFLGAAHDTEAVRGWIAFHTGAPISSGRAQAQFALGTWVDLAPPADFPLGTPDYPDRSVTLIVEMDALQPTGATLRGPGIRDTARLNLPDPAAHRVNHARFPLGFDCFFTAADRIAGLPQIDRGDLMYVAVKGGEAAIDAAHDWLSEERRGPTGVAELTLDQIKSQMTLAVARVMAEGSLHDADLAALAIKQARGDLIEAIFLIRAYRTTLPRFGASRPVDTGAMACDRRISATFKDLPGGQVLGPTFDYTHRLLDFKLAADGNAAAREIEPAEPGDMPRVTGFLDSEGLIEDEADTGAHPQDLTRTPLELPASRALRLQTLARADEGFLLGLAYSTQRGYARNHAFVGELRIGAVAVEMEIPELGFAIEVGEITLTECETVNQFRGTDAAPPQFTRGYGLVFGQSERKAISMALVDRALRWKELGEDDQGAPAQDEEFVLYHADNIQATGFLEHIKLPHYVDFQSETELLRKLRRDFEAAHATQEAAE